MIEFGLFLPENSCDEQTIEIILSIIHGRTGKVPRELGLETLAMVAVLVDFYQCHDVMAIAMRMWFDKLKYKPEIVSSLQGYSRNLVLWITVCCVMSEETHPGTGR